MNLLGAPTVEFCEKAGLGLIKRPFYAISNLAYLFVGLFILYKGKGSSLSKAFGYVAILIGLLSFVYDASYTYISQLADLLGMFLFVHLVIYYSARRYFQISPSKLIALQALSVVAGMLSIIYFKSFSGEFVFGVYIILAIALELLLWRKGKTINISLWLKGLSVFILGFIIWLPDAMGILCDPNDYINGRSIFHVLTSVTIYLLYKYYELQTNNPALNILKSGGLVIMPTDTLYGVVGSSLNKETVERIYNVRGRDENKPCNILIGDLTELKKFSIDVTQEQKKIIESSTRPTSFVLDCPSEEYAYLHRGTKTLAFRIPKISSLRELLLKTGPLSAPSANPQGLPPATNIEQAKKYFGEKIDMYIDGGEIIGEPSRVIKLNGNGSTEVLR